MKRLDLSNPLVMGALRAFMPMGHLSAPLGLIVGVMHPDAMPGNKPRVLICNTDNPDNDDNGNEVVMLTLEQVAFLIAAMPKIVEYIERNGFKMPQPTEVPLA